MRGARRHRGANRFAADVAVAVHAVAIDAQVKELLVRLLQAMRSGQEQRIRFGDATISTEYLGCGRGGRRPRGWVLQVQQTSDSEPYEIEVGFPPTKVEIGWIDQQNGCFMIVGTRVAIVARLVTALGLNLQSTAVQRVG